MADSTSAQADAARSGGDAAGCRTSGAATASSAAGRAPTLAPGMRVLIRGQEWLVKRVETNTLGNEAVYCTGVSQLVRDRESIFLADLDDIQPIDPAKTSFVPDESPNYRRTRLYLESQLRGIARTGSTLYTGHRAAMDTMPYQYEPANQALGQLRQRILIADSTGLGKTLEAGILMSELIARGKGRRILVVTSKSMLEQFQKEMWDRFTIPLVRLDSAKIAQVRATLPANANPFYYYDKSIVSIDTLKRNIEYGVHLENAYWDIIVIDEAQNVASRGGGASQRARLADKLAGRSDTLIMLSATPHDGSARSFASLMTMLDPTAIADPEDYGPDDIQGLFVRRFKGDVRDQAAGSFQQRDVRMVPHRASPAEEAAFDCFSEMELAMDLGKRAGAGQLFKTTIEKALFSSPAACAETIDHRLDKLLESDPDDETGDALQLMELRELVGRIDADPESFSRYQALLGLLRSADFGWNPKDPEDRVVVFTERVATMNWVAEQLQQDLRGLGLKKGAIATLYGGMSDTEQQEIVGEFARRESPLRVLVATDVASEGINLHYYCHRLVHFDTPWSLMVFQQRNGRIDRYGQSRRPLIRFLAVDAENERIHGDARILQILIDKEKQANENIGDPTMLMGKYIQEDEEDRVRLAFEAEGGADDLERELDEALERGAATTELDKLLALCSESAQEQAAEQPATATARTLMSDADYLDLGLKEFGRDAGLQRREPIRGEAGERIWLDSEGELSRRMRRVMPGSVDRSEAGEDSIVLSPDKDFVMRDMDRARRGGTQLPGAWPQAQYLWPLHPVFDWLSEKTATRLYARDQAPLLTSEELAPGSLLFLVSGMVPNRKSSPVVEDWFGLLFEGASADDPASARPARVYGLEEAIALLGLRKGELPNRKDLPEGAAGRAAVLCPRAVDFARARLKESCEAYRADTNPRIDEELDKLAALQEKHRGVQEQLGLSERRLSQKEREIDELFDGYVQWVNDTLEIEDQPVIRVWAAWTGVRS